MANEKAAVDSLPELAARLAAVESLAATQGSILQQVQVTMEQALQDFAPVAARVSELSTAFQAANKRLAAAEGILVGLGDQVELTAQVGRMQEALTEVQARLSGVEATRTRSGRLGARLAGIEKALADLAGNTPPTGGTQ